MFLVFQIDWRNLFEHDVHKHHKSHKKIDVMRNSDVVPSKVQSARQEALLYVFEDNEAVTESHNETRFQNPQSCS